jgi:ABC-type transporter Mla MlaB component
LVEDAMLRITDVVDTRSDGHATWTLKVEGSLAGEWLPELQRAWRRARETVAGAAIRVHLADVRYVDAAGKALLADMYRAGVDIVARRPGCRDPRRHRPPRGSRSTRWRTDTRALRRRRCLPEGGLHD